MLGTKIAGATFDIIRGVNATVWGCTVAAGQGIKEAIKFSIKVKD